MAENYINAEKDYVKGMKYKDIAEKYKVSINTVKSWKTRRGWTREKGAHKTKRVHTKARGAPPGNKNAVGNNGGAPKRNTNAVTHGFFSKFLPAETLEIMEQMQERSPADLIYDQIQIQYAAIIRAQKIMWVEDADSHLITESGYSSSDTGGSTSYKVVHAHERFNSFLSAQSRAMAELRNLIRHFSEMVHEDDERRLKIELMQVGITRTKAEIEKISGDNDEGPIEIMISRKGGR